MTAKLLISTDIFIHGSVGALESHVRHVGRSIPRVHSFALKVKCDACVSALYDTSKVITVHPLWLRGSRLTEGVVGQNSTAKRISTVSIFFFFHLFIYLACTRIWLGTPKPVYCWGVEEGAPGLNLLQWMPCTCNHTYAYT